jgi:predicted restriction endonuclease
MRKPFQWKVAAIILYEQQRRMTVHEINDHPMMKLWYKDSDAKFLREQTQRRLDMRVSLEYSFVTSTREKNHLIFGKTMSSKFFLTTEGQLFVESEVVPEFTGSQWQYDSSKHDDLSDSSSDKPPARVNQNIERIVRNTAIILALKKLYDNECQMCGTKIVLSDETSYSEGAHVRPLSESGPDIKENVLILCPNHHALIDHGEVTFSQDGSWHSINDAGVINYKPGHTVDWRYFDYIMEN